MSDLKTRMKEFLDDTIKYYSEHTQDRRCNDPNSGQCFYDPMQAGKPLSEGCAIGRYMTQKAKTEAKYDIEYLMTQKPELVPEVLRDMPLQFLKEMQALHDLGSCWHTNRDGLSAIGKDRVSIIRKKFGL